MENENVKGNELVKVTKKEDKKCGGGSHRIFSRLIKFIGRLIKKGNENYINIVNEGKEPLKINLTITVLFFLFAFWAGFIILVAGLFFGYRYFLDGPNFNNSRVNDYLGKASDAAQDIKSDFKDGYKNA